MSEKVKRQFTRDEVVERGEYVGFRETRDGGTLQFWKLGGIVFRETVDPNGFRTGFNCCGKAVKAAMMYGIELAEEN